MSLPDPALDPEVYQDLIAKRFWPGWSTRW
jgi:hypothetical protein